MALAGVATPFWLYMRGMRWMLLCCTAVAVLRCCLFNGSLLSRVIAVHPSVDHTSVDLAVCCCNSGSAWWRMQAEWLLLGPVLHDISDHRLKLCVYGGRALLVEVLWCTAAAIVLCGTTCTFERRVLPTDLHKVRSSNLTASITLVEIMITAC